MIKTYLLADANGNGAAERGRNGNYCAGASGGYEASGTPNTKVIRIEILTFCLQNSVNVK